jgi:hypothetical protein
MLVVWRFAHVGHVCGTSWLTVDSFCIRVAPVCFLVRVYLGEEFWFDGKNAAPAGGTLGSLCWYRLPVLGVFLECVNYLVILGVVARVVVVTPP